MKILIFSDTHLSHRFEEKKYTLLRKIIEEADQVIINGDFWDGYLTTFDKFVNSPWKQLFPLLKAKNAVYIYGNHDQSHFCDDRVNLFSTKQTLRYEIQSKDTLIVCEHGHRLYPIIDHVITSRQLNRIFTHVSDSIIGEILMRRTFFEKMRRRYNRVIKRKIKNELTPNQVYVCGHTHLAEYDIANRFINSGHFKFGKAQYLVINDGKMIMRDEMYTN